MVVVSVSRHCPAFGLLQTRLYILPSISGPRKADELGGGQTDIRSLPNKYPVGNKVVVLMPRENG